MVLDVVDDLDQGQHLAAAGARVAARVAPHDEPPIERQKAAAATESRFPVRATKARYRDPACSRQASGS